MEQKELYDLITKAREGDRDAFEELYQRFSQLILYRARSFFPVREDADDAAQEIVIVMFENLSSLKSVHAFTAWLNRIIYLTCMNRLNAKRSRENKEADDDIGEYSEVLPDGDRARDPDAAAEDNYRNEVIAALLHKLTDNQRECVLMYYYEDMGYREIAEVMGITSSTVSTTLLKAKKMMKKELSRIYGEKTGGKDILSGMAFAPAVGRAISYEMDKVVPGSDVLDFQARCHERIQQIQMRPEQSVNFSKSGARGQFSFVRTVILAVVIACAIAFCIIKFVPFPGKEASATEYAQTSKYQPNVTVEFTNEDCACGHVNPRAAELVIFDGDTGITGWQVLGEGDAVLYEGAGAIITEGLTELPHGTYKVRYFLRSQTTGETGAATRIFDVVKGVILPGMYE
ncbi:MAG: sigma-70 family RNA polymerase sigma factor [Clostridiales Family XIII bacterium]|nr:sigma-70 family RNA polymerase sigma factor [Clostridiales Family XIII bacterium]